MRVCDTNVRSSVANGGKADKICSMRVLRILNPHRTFSLARALLQQRLRVGGVYGQRTEWWSILYRCAFGIGASLRIAGRPPRRLCPTRPREVSAGKHLLARSAIPADLLPLANKVAVPTQRGDRMSNCVVGSGGSRLPCSTIAEHSVEGCDHFSHDGHDDDLGFFVGGDEAIVEGFEGGTVTACTDGGHVKDVTDRHPTTIDAAVSLELAAVEVIWCEADEGGDLFAAHLPEFWQQGDEREGQHRADAWHRGQQLIALSESHIGGNHLGQALVEEADISLQSHVAEFAEPPQHGIFEMSRLVLGRNMLVTQLSPHRHDLGEPFDRSVPLHNSCRHDRDILCDQPRIEAIVLGQHAAGAGELTKLARVDTSHRQSRREQGTDDSALVTTARLKANCGDCERAQPYDQLGPAGCVVTYRKEPPLRQHHHVQAVLRHVDTAKREHGHLRIPSLLMRARALATVRVWKKRPEHQAHSRSDIRDACGLPVATGAEL